MPRPERALDLTAGPLPRFAADLRELRRAAGGTPYRQMARTANYSASVLSDAAAGRRLPTLAATLAYVAACDGDQDEWRARWQALATEVAPSAAQETSPSEPEDVTPPPPDRRRRTIGWLAAAVVVLLGVVAFLTIRLLRTPEVPLAAGEVLPEHMVGLNPEATEAAPTHDDPRPNLPCSTLRQATACLDLAGGLVWVKDLPPGDGHHAAAYWTTTDGAAHGECHDYLTAEGPWATCPLTDLPDAARLGLRTAIVEKSAVQTWGPYQVVRTDG